MIRKLRIKFVAIIMVIVTIMLCIIFGLFYNSTQTSLEDESLYMMQTVASRPNQKDAPGSSGIGANLPENDPNNTPTDDIRLPYFVIYVDKNGNTETTDNNVYYDLEDETFVNEMLTLANASSKDTGVLDSYNLRFFKTEAMGEQTIVFADISSETSTLESMIQTFIIVGALSLLAFFIIAILLSKWAVRPVEKAWQQQRQFVADASHELKTPLSVILTNSQLALSDDYTSDEKKQFTQNIVTVSGHMKVLVEQMLELARADIAPSSSKMADVDFSSLVGNTVLLFEAKLFEDGHEVESDIDDGIKVHGDEQQLAQVVEGLLDNAGKYASDGGKVAVSLKKQSKSHCLLTVANEGTPIPEDQLSNLFKRFYRADSARSRDGSFGLGLSIAQSTVKKHKGKIWAESKDGYNSFKIQLHIK